MEEENQDYAWTWAEAVASEGEAVPAAKEFERWALAKGHIPDGHKTGLAPVDKANPRNARRGPRFRGDFHRGPHVAVVAQHMGWGVGKVVSESEYDKAVQAAYSIDIKER